MTYKYNQHKFFNNYIKKNMICVLKGAIVGLVSLITGKVFNYNYYFFQYNLWMSDELFIQ